MINDRIIKILSNLQKMLDVSAVIVYNEVYVMYMLENIGIHKNRSSF